MNNKNYKRKVITYNIILKEHVRSVCAGHIDTEEPYCTVNHVSDGVHISYTAKQQLLIVFTRVIKRILREYGG